MVFSSYIFVFLFLPVTLTGYFLLARFKNPVWQKLFLIAASLFFYGYFRASYLLVISASILVNYGLARGMRGRGRLQKALLVLGVLFNVALLGYFKYTDFLLENVNAAFGTSIPLRHILLPLGISFFTFQQLSFLLAVYRGESRAERFIDYCLFVTFFPQLVAGPIVLYEEMLPQFADGSRRRINPDNLARGVYVFVLGLFMKLVLADTVALFADNGFAERSLTLAGGWVSSLSYTVQIFFDFAGYAAMAVGLGKMFNIDLPDNFDRPYASESITVFWRRWHMTLGRALSTYVYRPLGGSRHGLPRTCFALFLTFFVSGVWHGAAWTFVLWGALNGLLVVLERLLEKPLAKLPLWLRRTGTFLTVNALWVLFRANSFETALKVWRGMVNFRDIGLFQLADIAYDGLIGFPHVIRIAYVLLLLMLLLFLAFRWKRASAQAAGFLFTRGQLMLSIGLFALSVIHMARESIFIYFNF